MSEVTDELGPLPAEKLCDRWGKGNPILGDGALGNEKTGKMYYAGEDKKNLVTIVQKMLTTLGYDLGTSGVDGKFGDFTEKAVRDFQGENKNWDGEQLKVDGLVGPRTADALNRVMVGIWYDHYPTPRDLVEGKPYHTVTTEFLDTGLSIKPGQAKEGKVFIVGQIQPPRSKTKPLEFRVLDPELKPYRKKKYYLDVEGGPNIRNHFTDDEGWIQEDVPIDAKKADLRLMPNESTEESLHWVLQIEPIPPVEQTEGALIRLRNLGYYSGPILKELSEECHAAIRLFQEDWEELEINGELDEKTKEKIRKLHDE